MIISIPKLHLQYYRYDSEFGYKMKFRSFPFSSFVYNDFWISIAT